MVNISAAITELGHIESFLRSRYHYPHPIFARLATLQEHLAEDVGGSTPSASVAAVTSTGSAGSSDSPPTVAPEEPSQRTGRTTKRATR